MVKTTKEILAKAEFWAMQAMNEYEGDSDQHKTLESAYNLIKTAGEMEERAAYNRALKAAQII